MKVGGGKEMGCAAEMMLGEADPITPTKVDGGLASPVDVWP